MRWGKSSFNLQDIETLMKYMTDNKIDCMKFHGLELYKSRHEFPNLEDKKPSKLEIDELALWSAK